MPFYRGCVWNVHDCVGICDCVGITLALLLPHVARKSLCFGKNRLADTKSKKYRARRKVPVSAFFVITAKL